MANMLIRFIGFLIALIGALIGAIGVLLVHASEDGVEVLFAGLILVVSLIILGIGLIAAKN